MYSSRMIYKNVRKHRKKIIKNVDSSVSFKLEKLFKNTVMQYDTFFQKKIKDLKNQKKQLKEEVDNFSNKAKFKNEIKDLKSKKKKVNKKIEFLDSIIGKWDFEDKLEEKCEKILIHSKCVFAISLEINSEIKKKNRIKRKLIEYSAIMHDAIKIIDPSYSHSVKAAYLINKLEKEKFFKKKLNNKDIKMVSKAISFHNRGEKIQRGTKYYEEDLLACIIHDADKISKIYKKKTWKGKKYRKINDYEKELKKIRKKLFLVESEKVLMKHLIKCIDRELSFI